MAPSLGLDDHQRFVLMKFKRSVNDILLPHHDDKFLLRWLRARSWQPEMAEAMLRKSMEWRHVWEVDGGLKTWQPSEALDLYFVSGTSGFDKDGAPVVVVPFGRLDIIGLLHAVGRQDIIKITVKILEQNMELAAQRGTNQVVAIFDMDGFVLRNYAWRPAAEVVVALLQMYEANYPEILKACYIINAPRVFAIAFNVVKRFLNEYTLGKIEIFKSDPKKWKRAILANIDPDNIPQHFGGSLVDPDGNPKYTTIVKQGGKVPTHMYKQHFEQNVDEATARHFTSVVIKKGDKLILDYIVAEEGCFLKWDFRTEGHDIRFGITRKDVDGNATVVVPHRRVASNKIDENGVVSCQSPATYTVTFDNSYSLLRSKKLTYEILLTPSAEKLEILLQANEDSVEQGMDVAAMTD